MSSTFGNENGVKSVSTVPMSESNDTEQESILLQPLAHILQSPGKNVRHKLAQAFNLWLRLPEERVREIGDVVQMLHNASLLVDDIEDNSELRRGVPVAHKIFGVASTINCSTYTMMIALERMVKMGPQAVAIFSEQMLELHRGQGMEIYWRDNYHCPTEDEYRQMTVRKTGGLFNFAVRLMQLFSDSTEDYVGLTSLLGLYFQVRDDFANLRLPEYAENKSFAEDLTEGKFSFPLIHSIRNHPEDPRVLNILRQRTTDIELKKFCVKLLEAQGSFAYTVSVLEKLDGQLREEVQRLGGNHLFIKLLDELVCW